MLFRYCKINRLLCQLLAVMVLTSPYQVLAQTFRPDPGNRPIQVFERNSQKQRAGGSSFGTSTRSEQGPAYLSDMQQPGVMPFQGPSYQVHILGEVESPGTYRVPASTRLSEAIELAGSILERGSMRAVELRRRGNKQKHVDLVAFKILGDLENNPYLLDNDVVFIPLKQKIVQISGAVKRPDSYELTKKTTLRELTRLAGGFSPGVALSIPAKVIRYSGEEKKLINVVLTPKAMGKFVLKNADVVVIPHILTKDKSFDYNLAQLPGDEGLFYPSFEERIFVIGAVNKPGPLPYSPYYSVKQYLTLAGGLSKIAKEKKMHILAATGEVKAADNMAAVNPGDTIVVPERYLRPENWLTLVLGISSTVLGITTAVLTLTR